MHRLSTSINVHLPRLLVRIRHDVDRHDELVIDTVDDEFVAAADVHGEVVRLTASAFDAVVALRDDRPGARKIDEVRSERGKERKGLRCRSHRKRVRRERQQIENGQAHGDDLSPVIMRHK